MGKEVAGSAEKNWVILIADDEELMREVVAMTVEENGGKAMTASGGSEALSIFNQHRDKIDCVFLDFSMPGMNGYETYVEMRKIEPELCAVFFSGLEMSAEVADLVRKREIEFLGKPFRAIELLKAAERLRAARDANQK